MKSKNKSGKKKLKTYSNLKSTILILKSFLPLLLSHHPECKRFKGHTIKIGKVRLCIGCFIGYPSALLGIFLIDNLNFRTIISLQAFLTIGIVCLSFFFLSFTRLTKIKIIKIIQKFFIGIGSSFLYWYIGYQPISLSERYFIFNIVFGIIITVLNLYHAYGFYTNCHKCDIPFGWHICEGFKSIRLNFKRYNRDDYFNHFEVYSEKIVQKRKRRN